MARLYKLEAVFAQASGPRYPVSTRPKQLTGARYVVILSTQTSAVLHKVCMGRVPSIDSLK